MNLQKRSYTSSAMTLTIRYTVKAKTENEATLGIKSWLGKNETSEREIKMPLDKPLDITSLAPNKDDRVEIKLEETLTDKKLKVGRKEFTGTIYRYTMAVDLFGGLGLEGSGKGKKKTDGDKRKPKTDEEKPAEKPNGKPIEMTIGIFLSPEAPVLGMVSMSMDGIQKVVYKLSDGTGVGPLLYPSTPKGPSLIEQAQVGDWLEYHGKNNIDDQLVTLRHTVLGKVMQPIPNNKEGKEQPALKIEAVLLVDGKEVSKWEFVEPTNDGLYTIPRCAEWGYAGELQSFSARNGGGKTTRRVLGDTWIEIDYSRRLQLTLKVDKKVEKRTPLFYAEIARHPEVPLTGISAIKLERQNVVDVELLLEKASRPVKITMTVPQPRAKKTSNSRAKE